MTKRTLKKDIYRKIIKEKRSHQTVFEELRTQRVIKPTELIEEIAKYPSPNGMRKYHLLVIFFIISLSMLLVIRLLPLQYLTATFAPNKQAVLITVLVSMIVPVFGISVIIRKRFNEYKVIGLLLILGIIRSGLSIAGGKVAVGYFAIVSPVLLVLFLPLIACIVFAFLIPSLMKTNYTKQVKVEEVNGVKKKYLHAVFDSNGMSSSDEDLLDSELT